MSTSDDTSIRERVEAFIRDYFDWNNRCLAELRTGARNEPSASSAKDALTKIYSTHFFGDDAVQRILQAGISFSSTPNHDPGNERMVDVRLESPDRAVVETHYQRSDGIKGNYEYVLERIGLDWRLVTILHFFSGRNAPFPAEPRLEGLARTAGNPLKVKLSPDGIDEISKVHAEFKHLLESHGFE